VVFAGLFHGAQCRLWAALYTTAQLVASFDQAEQESQNPVLFSHLFYRFQSPKSQPLLTWVMMVGPHLMALLQSTDGASSLTSASNERKCKKEEGNPAAPRKT
jgi:hypothetical protein